MSSLTIVCPNNRRVMVKIQPSTILFQVLDEACKRQGYDTEKFKLKSGNKDVDLSQPFRLSQLPNNVTLDVIPDNSIKSTQISLKIRLENGSEISKVVPVSSNFFDLLLTLFQENSIENPESTENEPVVRYLNQEFIGVRCLKFTTFRSLGVRTKILILYYRKEVPSDVMTKISSDIEERAATARKLDQIYQKKVYENLEDALPLIENTMDNDAEAPSSFSIASAKLDLRQAKPTTAENPNSKNQELLSLPCDRKTVIFMIEERQPIIDYPDEFYELSKEELVKEMERMKSEKSEAETFSFKPRPKECDAKVPQFTIVRIRFPNKLIVQGIFHSLEKISAIYDFVQSLPNGLTEPFELVAVVNQKLTKMDQTLFDAKLCPKSMLFIQLRNKEAKINDWLEQLSKCELVKSEYDAQEIANHCLSNVTVDRPVPETSDNSNQIQTKSSSPPRKVIKTTGGTPKWFKK